MPNFTTTTNRFSGDAFTAGVPPSKAPVAPELKKHELLHMAMQLPPALAHLSEPGDRQAYLRATPTSVECDRVVSEPLSSPACVL